MSNTQESTEDHKQINVRMPRWLHDTLTMVSARRTVAAGKEITRQDIVIDAVLNYRQPLRADVLGRKVRLDWDSERDRYVGQGVWSGVEGWATMVPLTLESFVDAPLFNDEEVAND